MLVVTVTQSPEFQAHQRESQSEQKCGAEENQRKGRQEKETRETETQRTVQVGIIISVVMFWCPVRDM